MLQSVLFLLLFSILTMGQAASPKARYEQALTEKDNAKKVALLTQSAEGGYLPAQLIMATAYLTGAGVPLDPAKGKKLLDQAAASGTPEAQEAMGFYYSSGLGGTINLPEAVAWYEKAAAQNYPSAQAALGAIYFWEWKRDETKTITRDIQRAIQLLTKAADQKNALAQGNLGSIYLYGDGGVPKNPTKAFDYALSAAGGGNMASCFDLAVMYYDGLGVQANRVQAQKLLHRALQGGFRTNLQQSAQNGSAEAQSQLQKLDQMKRDLGL